MIAIFSDPGFYLTFAVVQAVVLLLVIWWLDLYERQPLMLGAADYAKRKPQQTPPPLAALVLGAPARLQALIHCLELARIAIPLRPLRAPLLRTHVPRHRRPLLHPAGY